MDLAVNMRRHTAERGMDMKKRILAILMIAILVSLLCNAACAATFHQNNGTAPAPYGNTTSSNSDATIRFQKSRFLGGQNFAVYSGPGYEYYRAGGGWAKMLTDEPSYVAGREGDWILVMYPLKNGYRVGYVDRTQLKYTYSVSKISMAYTDAVITTACGLTQDPISVHGDVLVDISAGEHVTYLAQFHDKKSYAFIELEVEDEWVRGFVPLSCISR